MVRRNTDETTGERDSHGHEFLTLPFDTLQRTTRARIETLRPDSPTSPTPSASLPSSSNTKTPTANLMTDTPLGPMQNAWNTWNSVHKQVMDKPFEHFPKSIMIQIQEVEEHRGNHNRDGAINEMIDIISVSLNWLRWTGLNDHQIAERMRLRTANRYEGKAQAILDKYMTKYGI